MVASGWSGTSSSVPTPSTVVRTGLFQQMVDVPKYTGEGHNLASGPGCAQIPSFQERVLPLTSAFGGCCMLEDVLWTLQKNLSHEQRPFLEYQCHIMKAADNTHTVEEAQI